MGVRIISKKLKIRFHNPNTPEVTADYIARVLVTANQKKVEELLKERAREEGHGKVREEDRYLA